MSDRRIRYVIVFLLPVLLLAMICCDRQSNACGRMDLAESLMASEPDSALVILDNIPKFDLKGERESARYALLKSMALDKNYIDTTTFDVLQPAIDYYIENGSPDEKLKTLYYQGRIYQNQGDDDSAMRSFMNAIDFRNEVHDSLLLANNYVALGTLYFKQYKIDRFVECNLDAARLYGITGSKSYEIISYANAIDGYVMLNDKAAVDSVLSICIPLTDYDSEYGEILFPAYLSYIIEFGSDEEINKFLHNHQNRELTQDDVLNFAQGYSKIGEYKKAINLVSDLHIEGSTLDSLKYLSVKTRIFEKQGDFKQAFFLYKEYSAMLEIHQNKLLSQDLLFAEERHRLEMDNLYKIQKKDRIIWSILCGSFGLLILVGWLYYGYRLSGTKRLIAEKENYNLLLKQSNLKSEKDRVELERDKKALEVQNLEKEKTLLVYEQHQRELEAANIELEKKELEEERDNLKELLKEQTELSKPVKDIIKKRFGILNGLLAKEIANNDNYAIPYNKWIESLHNDKGMFMNSTRLAFSASHPRFIKYLELRGLTVEEINYLCLYAIGLRGKEVGEYIKIKRHYNISSEIRKKLGIDEHETNIGIYIRKKMDEI